MSNFGSGCHVPRRVCNICSVFPFHMPSVHLTENWRQAPSWYQTSWKVKHSQGSKSGREWDEGHAGSSAEGGTYTAADGGGDFDKCGAKKLKTKDKYLKNSSVDLWRVRAKLDGKKRSLSKTYKTSKETNDRVYALNQQMSKHLETLPLRKEAEEKFDPDFNELLEKVAASRARCLEASAAHDRSEMALNEGLCLVRKQFEATAAATLSLTVGNPARSTHVCAFLQEALEMLDALLIHGSHDEGGY